MVFEDRGGAERVLGFEVWWGEERGALVVYELVGDVEFFEQPGDTLALADLEMVNGEVWCCHVDTFGDCNWKWRTCWLCVEVEILEVSVFDIALLILSLCILACSVVVGSVPIHFVNTVSAGTSALAHDVAWLTCTSSYDLSPISSIKSPVQSRQT